jgi:hypothetical protein
MKTSFTLSFLFILNLSWGQLGKINTYEFLSLPVSARITALSGVGVFHKDEDLNLATINPSLLNEKMDNSLVINHNYNFADIANGYVGYAKQFKDFTAHLGFVYMNYGTQKITNDLEEVLGEFSASDRAVVLGVGKQLNERINAGVNVKGVFSSLESYQSSGLAVDASLSYSNPLKNIVYSFIINNFGSELKSYNNEKLNAPLNIQIGLSKKLAHLPLRFSVIAHQLQQWNIRYDDPNAIKVVDLLGQTNEAGAFSKTVDNVFRHLLFNAELSLGKTEGFQVRAGYNHFRRKELNLSKIRSLAGFSFGFGIKIKQFNLDYGLGYYHLAGAANHLSIRTNLDRFKKKITM